MQDNTPAIEAKNLTKKFGDFTAVDNVSFTVNHGQIFALLGPNGAGKSTIIKILTTLLEPTSGEAQLNNFSTTKQQDQVRKSFGIVFQDPSLDSDMTAYENMQLHAALYGVPVSETNKKITDLLQFVELWDKKDVLVKNFSGGMRRRLEIARSLLHHPKVLFLDEPTLGLDPQTRNHMWEYVKNLKEQEGMTILFTTHYMQEAEDMAENIAIIDHGKIITSGTPEQLKQQTNTTSLEAAFLKLTGTAIREEEASSRDNMRAMMQRRTR